MLTRLKHQLPFTTRDYRRLTMVSLAGKGCAIGASGFLVAGGGLGVSSILGPSLVYWTGMGAMVIWIWNRRQNERGKASGVEGADRR